MIGRKSNPCISNTISGRISLFCNVIATTVGYLSTLVPLFFSHFFFGYIASKILFIYLLSEVLFACWLISAIVNKKYREIGKSIFIAILIYIVVLILAAILGVDPNMSFWSNYSRGTGLIFIIHLFLYFIAASRLFDKQLWHEIMGILALIGALISLVIVCGYLGFIDKDLAINYATAGNSSFLAAYILFALFLAVYLGFSQEVRFSFLIFEEQDISFLMKISAFCSFIGLLLSTGRAAAISSIVGLFFLFCLVLAFKSKNKTIRIIGKLCLSSFVIIIMVSIIMLNVSGSFIQNKFSKFASPIRPVVWKISSDLVREKPLLGYGPENFERVFSTKASPELFFASDEKELRFDKAHSIIWDTLISGGILGLVSYLFIFFISFLFLWKNKKSFWLFAVFSSLMIAYFLQNLTVFDAPIGYFMFFLILSYLSSLQLKKVESGDHLNKLKVGLIFLVIILFLFSCKFFIVKQCKTLRLVTYAVISTENIGEKTEFLQKAEKSSSWGIYQAREYYADSIFNAFSKENLNKEKLTLAMVALEKNRQERPYDFYNLINMAKIGLELEDFRLVENVLNEAGNINNKNAYYLSYYIDLKIAQKQYKEALDISQRAISLEPRTPYFYNLALKIVKLMKDDSLITEYKSIIEEKFPTISS